MNFEKWQAHAAYHTDDDEVVSWYRPVTGSVPSQSVGLKPIFEFINKDYPGMTTILRGYEVDFVNLDNLKSAYEDIHKSNGFNIAFSADHLEAAKKHVDDFLEKISSLAAFI